VRRIALRPPTGYFGQPSFRASNSEPDYTFIERVYKRVRATVARKKRNPWVVEKPENTRSLPAAASGISASAHVEE
jgi:hypothetical protein